MNHVRAILATLLMCGMSLVAHGQPTPVIDLPDLGAQEILAQAEHWMDVGLELAEENRSGSAAAFGQAATRYETLVTQHGARNTSIFRAMGVAKLHAGDVAGSIVSLRAAEALDPTDRRTRESLSAARERVEAAPEIAIGSRAAQWVGIWRGWVPRSALLGTGLGVLAIGWFMGASYAAWQRPRRLWIVSCFLAAVLPLGLLGFDLWQGKQTHHVVLMQEAVGRGGPSAEVYHPTFEDPLPEGLEGVATQTRSGWTQMRLASGEQTWVRSDTLIGVEELLDEHSP